MSKTFAIPRPSEVREADTVYLIVTGTSPRFNAQWPNKTGVYIPETDIPRPGMSEVDALELLRNDPDDAREVWRVVLRDGVAVENVSARFAQLLWARHCEGQTVPIEEWSSPDEFVSLHLTEDEMLEIARDFA